MASEIRQIKIPHSQSNSLYDQFPSVEFVTSNRTSTTKRDEVRLERSREINHLLLLNVIQATRAMNYYRGSYRAVDSYWIDSFFSTTEE